MRQVNGQTSNDQATYCVNNWANEWMKVQTNRHRANYLTVRGRYELRLAIKDIDLFEQKKNKRISYSVYL